MLVTKIFHECNYFQANEGNLDPSHVSYLHRQANVPENLKRPVKGSDGKLPLALYEADVAPEIEAEETDYGVRIFSLRNTEEGRTFFRVTNFILPNMATIPGPMSGDGYNLYCHVPIDDTHHWRYDIVFRRSAPMEAKDIATQSGNPRRAGPGPPAQTQQGESLPAGSRVDEELEFLRAWDGSSTSRTPPSSKAAARSSTARKEFLGPSDRAIIAARRQLLRAIRDVEAGREAPHVVRNLKQQPLSRI